MKKTLKVILFAAAVMMMVTGCSKKEGKGASAAKPKINLWSFTNEIPGMVEKYQKTVNNSFDFETTIIATTDGAYQPALDQALQNGEVDMFGAESAFVLKYTQGDMSDYAAPYADLGIDINNAIRTADIAGYTVDLGSNTKGQVVGLGYQATGGVMIYNAGVAKKLLGTDDPKKVSEAIGGGSGSWDKWLEVAKKAADMGIAMCSGDGDPWHAIEPQAEKGWVVDGKLYIDPAREAFIDMSKFFADNNITNGTQDWQPGWFADMAEEGPRPTFCFFGPAWLLNYSMKDNVKGEFGNWRVTDSPVGFWWGGTWVIATKEGAKNEAKKNALKDIIYWITLDPTSNGLLYQWATGTFQWEFETGPKPDATTKDAVSSATVMAIADGKVDICNGQNIFDYFIPAGSYANGKNKTQYDETINSLWRDQVRAYAAGQKSREDAIATFKSDVADQLGLAAY